ncbi:predicted protein [Nematostella vectensis]|uniref:PWWP domain-containing protein n=1 Tax=Nematostella vectensis TaxID=45351 RepID=A7SVC9_NEMVE|nr:PWWP domain-containing protein 2A [Nematostella vectensis]EDO32351.1 predicted protein [Nematostella vectensis]|eukprot:XP_001624451.1 predicted protein [Nematostella vectensis]
MASFKVGSIVSATVEQALENCIMVKYKRGSRTFRGVLFDEKNSVVSRIPLKDEESRQKMATNTLPARMAVVSPSKATYSSLRSRACTLNNRRGIVNLSPKPRTLRHEKTSNGSKKGNSLPSQSTSLKSSNPSKKFSHATRDIDKVVENKNGKSQGVGGGLKRSAPTELVNNKPSKAVKTGQETVGDSSRAIIKKSRVRQRSDESTNMRERLGDSTQTGFERDSLQPGHFLKTTPSMEDENVVFGVNGSDVVANSSSGTVKRSLFLPEVMEENDSVFRDDVSHSSSSLTNEETEVNLYCDEPPVDVFLTSLGLDHELTDNKKDGSKTKDNFPVIDSPVSNSDEISEPTDKTSDDTVLTPVKKSARISAKRAKLEEIGINDEDDKTTIWSIWGASPVKKEQKQSETGSRKHSDTDSTHLKLSSTETHANQPTVIEDCNAASINEGSIIWGKVHGHPWWPGRVMAITEVVDDQGGVDTFAHVTWFGSNTSSEMPVQELQDFEPNFRRRYKKDKKGCYRRAVRQAQETLTIMKLGI